MRSTSKIFFIALLALIGCTTKTTTLKDVSLPGQSGNGNTLSATVAINPLSCVAVPLTSNVGSGEAFSVNITASNGTAPYSVNSTSFGNTTTIADSATNSGTNNLIVSKSVIVRDAGGNSVACSYQVTVRGSSQSGLACQIGSLNANPRPNEATTITVSASGGSGTYTFGNLFVDSADKGAFIASGASATKAYTFDTAGNKVISTIVTSNGNSSICSQSIGVYQGSVSLSNSAIDAYSTLITANPTGFPNVTVYYAFSVDKPWLVELVQSNNTVTARRKAGVNGPISATITASVTTSTSSVPVVQTILISFTQSPLTCYIVQKTPGALYTGIDYEFEVRGNTTAHPIYAGTFNAGPYATVVDLGNDAVTKGRRFKVNFSPSAVPAPYTNYLASISANAWSSSDTSVKCNADTLGAVPAINIYLVKNDPLVGCSISMDRVNPKVGDTVGATVSLTGGLSAGPYAVTVDVNNSTNSSYLATINPPTGNWNRFSISYSKPGVYDIAVRVRDQSSSREVTCNTSQTVTGGAVSGTYYGKFGFNFEDKHSDNDYNDAVFCFSGSFYLNGRTVYSGADQTASVKVGGSSGCSHTTRITVRNPYGGVADYVYNTPNIQYVSIPLSYGDTIEANMFQMCGQSSNISTALSGDSNSEGRYVWVEGNTCRLNGW